MSREIVDLDDFSKRLGSWSTSHLEDRRKAVIAGIARSIPDLVAASPVDQGLYAASWMMTETETSAIIGNSAPYAGIIENGALPHWTPLEPLLAWAKRVTGDPSQPPDYSPHVWSLAIAVRNKIAEFGQAPKHILRDMIPKIIENIKEELKK
jgi:hypothetical protein